MIHLAIVGAEKCGTTSLLRWLGQHPQLHTHASLEMNYFLLEREFRRGWAWARRRYFDAPGGAALAAKSVALLDHGPGLDRLYAHNPAVQVVALLRHPVERAWSAYWYARRRQREPLERFEAALAAEQAGEGGRSYLARGCYAPGIEALLARFGPAQVSVLLLEELRADPAAACTALWRRLQLPAVPLHQPARHNGAALPRLPWLARALHRPGPVKRLLRPWVPAAWAGRLRDAAGRWNERPLVPPPMEPATRRQLLAWYQPHNQDLAALLGRELSGWER